MLSVWMKICNRLLFIALISVACGLNLAFSGKHYIAEYVYRANTRALRYYRTGSRIRRVILPSRFIPIHLTRHVLMNSTTHNASAGQNKVFVGLDVHRDTIAVCVYDPELKKTCLEAEISSHDHKRLRSMLEGIRDQFGEPQCCYEASSCGYTLYRTLHDLGFACEVTAPSSVPRRAGDRIKTDRRDAAKLAQYYAAGLLTVIAVPDDALIRARSVVRRRVALVQDRARTKQRLLLFLQSRGHVYRDGRTGRRSSGVGLMALRLTITMRSH